MSVMVFGLAYGLTPATQSGRWLMKSPFPKVFVPMYTVSATPVRKIPSVAAILQPENRASRRSPS